MEPRHGCFQTEWFGHEEENFRSSMKWPKEEYHTDLFEEIDVLLIDDSSSYNVKVENKESDGFRCDVKVEKEESEPSLFEEVDVLVGDDSLECSVKVEKEVNEVRDNVNGDDEGYSTPANDMSFRDYKPFVGKEFELEQTAYDFYNKYSKLAGFSIKWNQTRRSPKTAEIIWRRFSCAKEGFHSPKPDNSCSDPKQKRTRYTSRTGCNARMIISKELEKNTWIVQLFLDEHTHDLISPKKVHFLRSHRRIDDTSKKFIEDCNKVGIHPSRAFHYMVEKSGGNNGVGFVKRDVQNVIRDVKMKYAGADSKVMCEWLNKKQIHDPHSVSIFKMDDECQLSVVFWVDGRQRSDFLAFGDVVCLDTTYKTNKYKMPFAPFVRLNHHGQSIFFGAGLLSNETTESFNWLFETFLQAMGNRAPKIIITDQDAAITAAVATMLRNTRHRYCTWHITQKFPEKLGHLYHPTIGFSSDVWRCLTAPETIPEFERSWQSLLNKYNLEGNQWLQSLYDVREKWIPVYFNDTFCGGMSTSQRSESMHAFIDHYMKSHTSLREFVEQFDKALKNRRDDEAKEDVKTKNNIITHRTPSVQLEKSLSAIYTMHNLKLSQEELFQSSAYLYAIESRSKDVTSYAVTHSANSERSRVVTYIELEGRAFCGCKMFERKGIVCRHIFCVLRLLGVLQLPACYIMKRLSRNPRDGLVSWDSTPIPLTQELANSTKWTALDQLWQRLREDATAIDYPCEVLTDLLSIQRQQIQKWHQHEDVKRPNHQSSHVEVVDQNIVDPPIVRTKGCGSASRIKSGKEISMAKGNGRCGVWHRKGHNRRTCPLLKCSLGRLDDNNFGAHT